MKKNPNLILVFLILISCKPVELKRAELINRSVFIHTPAYNIHAELLQDAARLRPKTERIYFWFKGGQIEHSQGGYSGKLLNGAFIAFHKANKKLAEKGEFTFGLKTGQWLSWHENGYLKEKSFYRQGYLSGKLVRFDSLGKPMDTLKYRRGDLLVKKTYTDTSGMFSRIRHKLFKREK